jgi:nucleoid-associated protein YejK
MEVEVKHVALHLVDKTNKMLNGPRLSKQEIKLETFNSADIEKIQKFFELHLTDIWSAPESKKTCPAMFREDSPIRDFYKALLETPSGFFELSCDMAKRLYDVSRGTASPGILMILLFNVHEDNRTFLGLLKMDPCEEDRITLSQNEVEDSTLFNFAVKHIDQALPDPGEKVHKWAIIPHPTRPNFDAKIKDEKAVNDLAQYYMDFLGCIKEKSEKIQVSGVIETINSYSQEIHHMEEEECKIVSNAISEKLGEGDGNISSSILVETIDKLGVYKDGFKKEPFLKKLEENVGPNLSINQSTIRKTKIEYTLSNGITIKGPLSMISSSLQIKYVFRCARAGR